MADLASTDVTVTLAAGAPHNPRIENGKKKCLVSIAFGDSTLTYPSGGVPMPAYTSFGMVRNLETLVSIDQGSDNAFTVKYDHANQKVRLFEGGNELVAATDAPPAMTIVAEASGW